jgi:hypothetical protein
MLHRVPFIYGYGTELSDYDKFDPYELEEIATAMDAISDGADSGYEIYMFITHNDAVDLVRNYHMAIDGDLMAKAHCWGEYKNIIYSLKKQIREAGRDDE